MLNYKLLHERLYSLMNGKGYLSVCCRLFWLKFEL